MLFLVLKLTCSLNQFLEDNCPLSPTPKTAVVNSLRNVSLFISSLHIFVFCIYFDYHCSSLGGREREGCVACLEDETELN